MTSVLGNVINTNGNRVFSLSSRKSQFEFLEESLRENKSLRKNQEYKNRLELIQDFHFSTSSGKVRVTKDGNYVGACGMYPPDLKVFECEELSMKFLRRVDCEIVDFQFLTEDYKKLVLMQNDRSLEFHAQGGRHHKLRIPHFGRSLSYDENSAQLWIATNSCHVYRLDLEEGVFLKPIKTSMPDNNIVISGLHHRVMFIGGSTGMEVWDTRISDSEPANFLSMTDDDFSDGDSLLGTSTSGVTAIAVKQTGFMIGLGSAGGFCRVFDVRHSTPLVTKDHSIDSPIVDMMFTNIVQEYGDAPGIISADERFVKLWDGKTSKSVATFEAQGKINGICQYPNSGLIFVAQDDKKIGMYYVDSIGLAPRWAAFLDNLVEEMEDANSRAIFDEYEFVTVDDLDKITVDFDDIKTKLKPHAHGFLISRRLYRTLREKAGLFKERNILTKRLEKLREAREMRPKVPMKPVEVNAELKASLEAKSRSKKHAAAAAAALEDERFSELFSDSKFVVDRV